MFFASLLITHTQPAPVKPTTATIDFVVMAEQYALRFSQNNVSLDTVGPRVQQFQLTGTAECDIHVNDRRVLLICCASERPDTTITDDGVPVMHIGAGERTRVVLQIKHKWDDVAATETIITAQVDARGSVLTVSAT